MYSITIILPLISAIILSITGRNIGVKGLEKITFIIMSLTIFFSLLLLYEILGNNIQIEITWFKWIEINDFFINFSFLFDLYSVLMLNLIIIISSIVQFYSLWYMGKDPHLIRFIIYLQCFTVMMSFFVLSNNLLFMFIGWEGVGVFSFFLINFWFTRIQANKSALKAMFYNRFGDACFLFGLIFFSYSFNSSFLFFIPFNTYFFNFFLFFLILAAFTKSAQIFFHPWLASSMEGFFFI